MLEHFDGETSDVLSQAVRAGDWLFISGQASVDRASGVFVPGTFEEEFARAIANLDYVLQLTDARREQIVKVAAFVRDESALPRFNQLYVAEFDPPRPARTTTSMGFAFLQVELDAIVFLG